MQDDWSLSDPTRRGEGASRRVFLWGAAVALFAGPVFAQGVTVPSHGGDLSVEEAHELAISGQVTLLDIRRPDEWAQTGSGEGAHRLDMRRKDFLTALDALVDGNRGAPIAVMCARGVRSAWLAKAMTGAGYRHVIDVPEGMMGSREGPGWIRIGLPIVR